MNSTSLVGRYNILNNKWGVFYTPNGCRISVYTRVSGGNGSGIAGTSFGEVSQEVPRIGICEVRGEKLGCFLGLLVREVVELFRDCIDVDL